MTEEWTIECRGCLSTQVIRRKRSETFDMHRVRASIALERHGGHIEQVMVTAPAWRQLDLFGPELRLAVR